MSARLISLVAVALLAACSPAPEPEASEPPLDISVASGGAGLRAPQTPKHWSGTFGGMLMCTHAGPVTITNVALLDPTNSEGARTLVRQVTPTGVQNSIIPVGSSKGDPEELQGGGEDSSLTPAQGMQITRPCQPGPREYDDGFDELILTLQADDHGSRVGALAVEYEAGGSDYTRYVDWEFFLCGRPGTADPDVEPC